VALLSFTALAQSADSNKQPFVDSLRPYAIPVRTINPKDEDFSDLKPLISKIGDATIVVLGEATHSEGTTGQAKARLVRFLHQQMGFDVVAWESSLVQTEFLNTALRDQTIPIERAKAYLMTGGWSTEEGVHPVFEYARATWQTNRPLEMAGFDIGRPPANVNFKEYLTGLLKRAPALEINVDDWKLVDSLLKRAYGFLSSEVPTEDQRKRERAVLEELLDKIQARHRDLAKIFSQGELAIAERFVGDALMTEQLGYLQRTGGSGGFAAAFNHARDRYMAESVRWLLNELYPHRKIIIWAATGHFIRNSDSIKDRNDPRKYGVPYEAGNHLYSFLGEKLYTIAFTAYQGKIGGIYPQGYGVETGIRTAEPAPSGSFEATAHELKRPYLFVDLRQAPREHWLRNEFISICLGRAEDAAPWSRVVDAFFFIDQAEPIRYLPRPK
jgi:erythromycin esterase